MAACAREPARSSAARRRSKPIETLIACISAPGLAEKRPPHSRVALGLGGRSAVLRDDDMGGVMVRFGGRWGRRAPLPWQAWPRLYTSSPAALPNRAGRPEEPGQRPDEEPGGRRRAVAGADDAVHRRRRQDRTPWRSSRARWWCVNLWATWCAPCVQEMPTLAKLAAADAGQPVAIVPISVDRAEDRANAKAFIAKRPPLPFYTDPTYALAYRASSRRSRACRPPLLIDAAGNGSRPASPGGADWSGPDAAAGGRGAGKGAAETPATRGAPGETGLTVAIGHAHFWPQSVLWACDDRAREDPRSFAGTEGAASQT